MKHFLFFVAAILVSLAAYSQNISQTIKGTITDKISEKPLAGASVVVTNGKTLSTVSNNNGQFAINNVATGRVTIMVSIVGFKTAVIPEVLVTAGKEVIMDIALEQEVKQLADVTVNSSRIKKGNASNEFAGASSRSFSMEEVTRFCWW